MALRAGVREALFEAAHDARVPHKPKGSLDVWLQTSGPRVKLAKSDGSLTPAGRLWKGIDFAHAIPPPLDSTQETVRQGQRHFVITTAAKS